MNSVSRTLILAHRGWSAAYPENTLVAMTKALELGVDGLEFDVQLTRDGVPIIMHDATVDRTTDGTGRVDELAFDEIRLLNAARHWSHAQDIGYQQIPTLTEVLDEAARLHPKALCNIEIKVHNSAWQSLVDTVMDVVAGHAMGSQVVFSSFQHPAMQYLKERYPQCQVALLYEGDPGQPWKDAKAIDAYSVNLDYHHTSDALILDCLGASTPVSLWTVDDASIIRHFIQKGVASIISNKPDVALKVRKVLCEEEPHS